MSWLTWQGRGCAWCLGWQVRQDIGEGDTNGAPAVGTREATEGRGSCSQWVVPVWRPLLLRQKRWLYLRLTLRLTVPIHGGQKIPVHSPVAQQRRAGVRAVRAVANPRVILLVKALSRTAAEGVAGHAASLAASRRAVGVGGWVDVRVVQGRRVVAVVQRHRVLGWLSGRGVAVQRGVAAQDGVLRPRLVDWWASDERRFISVKFLTALVEQLTLHLVSEELRFLPVSPLKGPSNGGRVCCT